MTSKILYKFKSSKDFDVIKFDGVQIRLFDLKRRIVERKGFDKESEDFELVVVNENTKEQYKDENDFIPKNSDLIVQRVPTTQRVGLLTRMKSTDKSSGGSSSRDLTRGSSSLNDQDLEADIFAPKPVANPAAPAPAEIKVKTEEDDEEEEEAEDDEKLKMVSMLAERIRGPTLARGRRFNNKSYTAGGSSGQAKTLDLADVSNLYTGDISQLNSKSGVMKGANQKKRNGVGAGGHGSSGQFQQKQKRENAGIPKSFVEQEQEQALAQGGAEETTSAQAGTQEAEGKVEGSTAQASATATASASWATAVKTKSEESEEGKEGGNGTGISVEEARRLLNPGEVPDALRCALDKSLLREAVLLPCCYRSCSLKTIQDALAQSNNTCPLCNKPNITPDQLVPNVQLREMVDSFLESKRHAPSSSTSNSDGNPLPHSEMRDRGGRGPLGPRGRPFFGGPRPPFPPFDGPRPMYGWDHFPPRGPMHRGPGPWMHHGPNPPRGDGPWRHHEDFRRMDRDPRWRPPMDYAHRRRSKSPPRRSRSIERRKRSRSRSPRRGRDRSRSPYSRRSPPRGDRERDRSRGRRHDDSHRPRRGKVKPDTRRREDRREPKQRGGERPRDDGPRRRERSPARGGDRGDGGRGRRRGNRKRSDRGRRRR